jgi:hypothetical protein
MIHHEEIKNNSENINIKKEKNNFQEKSEKNKELKINITNPNSVKIEKNEKNEQVLSKLVEKSSCVRILFAFKTRSSSEHLQTFLLSTMM